MAWSWNLHWKHPPEIEFNWWRHQLDHMTLSQNVFWYENYILGTRTKWWCHLLSPFVNGYHWFKFQLHTIYESWDSGWRVGLNTPFYKPLCKKGSTYEKLSNLLNISCLKARKWIFKPWLEEKFANAYIQME